MQGDDGGEISFHALKGGPYRDDYHGERNDGKKEAHGVN